MYDVFSSIRCLLKLDSISTDNNVFRLHYKVTMFILVAFSICVTQKQYFGDPIDCIVANEAIPLNIMDTYCWIHSTYTIPGLFNETIGKGVAHPGVGNNFNANTKEDHVFRYHKYYQWVTLFLYFQAILFYMPRYIWKVWECGKVKMLVSELTTPIVDEDEKTKRKNMLVHYFTSNMHCHRLYAYKFFFCEALNFANVIGQIYLTDRFLGYEFTTYGSSVLSVDEADLGGRAHPIDLIFPKVAKCTFVNFGVSGTLQNIDGLCVLPLNIFNEKIYIFLWFWFIIVAVISGIGLIYRAFTLFPPVRLVLLRTRSKLASQQDLELVIRKCHVGDWFLLHQIAKNMDPLIYHDFMADLASSLQGKPVLQ